MSIHHECVQGSKRWLQMRLGKPSASNFDRIVTPNGKLSESSAKYANVLLAEMMVGRPVEKFVSKWMERGQEFEGEAVRAYEFDYNVTTTTVGLFTNDAGTIGASPDRQCGPRSGLEVKVPAEPTQVARLLSGRIDMSYNPQLQGQLWVCEWDRIDNLYYSPDMPRSIIPVPRDEKYIKILADSIGAFVDQLFVKRLQIEKQYGFVFPEIQIEPLPDKDMGGLGVTDADIAEIYAGRFPMPQ